MACEVEIARNLSLMNASEEARSKQPLGLRLGLVSSVAESINLLSQHPRPRIVLLLLQMTRFAGQRFAAAVKSLKGAVEVRSTAASFGGARAIGAASRQHHAAALLGLHNAAPVRTGQRWLIAPGAGWAPAVLGLPYWPYTRARKVGSLSCLTLGS